MAEDQKRFHPFAPTFAGRKQASLSPGKRPRVTPWPSKTAIYRRWEFAFVRYPLAVSIAALSGQSPQTRRGRRIMGPPHLRAHRRAPEFGRPHNTSFRTMIGGTLVRTSDAL